MLKKIFIYLVAFLLSFQAMAQDMDLQATPFGSAELITCTTAQRVNGPLYFGVRVVLDKGWHLDDPNLTVTTSDGTPAALFVPFQQPYAQIPIYPISAVLTHKPTGPITFHVSGNWHACNEQECVDVPIQLTKTLGTGIALLTPECSGITLALSNTPIPMYMNKVAGWAIRSANGDLDITLDFKQVPKILTIYDQNKQPLTLDIQNRNKRATFKLPSNNEEKIRLFARTYHHYYEISLPILPEGTKVPPPHINLLQIIQACIMLVLFSAVPIFWARTTDTTPFKFHTQTKQAIWVAGAGIILSIAFCIYEYFYGIFNPTTIPFSKNMTLALMGLGLLFIPASPLFIPLFLVITPRSYLSIFEESSILMHFCLLLGFWLLTIAAFTVQLVYEKPIFKQLQQKNVSILWWCARLPWLGFMLYTFFYL